MYGCGLIMLQLSAGFWAVLEGLGMRDGSLKSSWRVLRRVLAQSRRTTVGELVDPVVEWVGLPARRLGREGPAC